MSRLGKRPIVVPVGVQVEIKDHFIKVNGPKGSVSRILNERIEIKMEDVQGVGKCIIAKRPSDAKNDKALHGLVHKIIENLVEGASKGFEKKLEVNGLGYKVLIQGNKLTLSIGYTHPIELEIPENIKVEFKEGVITVSGTDKEAIGKFSSVIRSSRDPDPYKLAGIKYFGEQIKKKVGKAVGKITSGA